MLAARGELCEGFHSLDVTKLGSYCAFLPSLMENYPESPIYNYYTETERPMPMSVNIEAIVLVLQALYIFYLFMIIRYREIFIEWTPYFEASLIMHLPSKYE